MTAPTLTYGQAFNKDFNTIYSASVTADGQTIIPSTAYGGDYMRLTCTVSAGNKTGYVYANTAGALGIPTNLYPKIIFRYRTGDATIKAKILAKFSTYNGGLTEAQNITAGNAQLILAETSDLAFHTKTVALTASKTVDHVLLFANGATGYVEYDFVMITQIFTFPQWGRLNLKLPNYYAKTRVPSKVTNRNSYMGADDAEIILTGDIDSTADGWERPVGTTTKIDGFPAQVLYEIQHNAYTEPFQWFTSNRGNFKVVIDSVEFDENGENTQFLFTYTVLAHEYSRANKSRETYDERYGLTGVT